MSASTGGSTTYSGAMKEVLLGAAYRKFQVALGGFLGQLILLAADGDLSALDYLSAAVAGLTAAGVIGVANKPDPQ